VTAKILPPLQRRAIVYDIERGKAEGILPQPWQTDTCLGQWHYNAELFEHHKYKSAASVIRMLADIVSKNGNLMLSVPLRRDGQPDSDEMSIVREIGAWLKVNGPAIYATRPWKTYGEGPSTVSAEKGEFDGQKDVEVKAFTSHDIRFTQSKDGRTIYAIALEIPSDRRLVVRSLSYEAGRIRTVSLLGNPTALEWKQSKEGLVVILPPELPCKFATSVAVELQGIL